MYWALTGINQSINVSIIINAEVLLCIFVFSISLDDWDYTVLMVKSTSMTLRKNKEMMTSTYFLKHGGLTAKVPICVKCQKSQRGFLARTIWFYDKHILGWLIRMLKDSKHLHFDKILSLIQIAATQLQYCICTENWNYLSSKLPHT